MRDRPILFSGPMVNAILEGRKTQTRRILKANTIRSSEGVICKNGHCSIISIRNGRTIGYVDTKYKVGDRLYVREAWSSIKGYDDLAPSAMSGEESILYRASTKAYPFMGRYRQGMHMPRWASRLTLVVTDVRVQRLQEISEEDVIAEGVAECEQFSTPERPEYWVPHLTNIFGSPSMAFSELWDSINDARGFGWDANPWVVAVTFETHKCNIDQMEAS